MIPIIAMIKEGLAIVNNLTNGDNKEKLFHVAMRKNHKKALDLAEDIFDLVDEYMIGEIKKLSFKKKYNRMKKKFNDLD